MIQNVLKLMGGIENYGVFSLCLFFLAFSATAVWALLRRRGYLARMSQLPLENETEPLHNRKDSE